MIHRLSKTEARQGRKTGRVRWILGISFALAILGLLVVGLLI